MDVSSSDGSVRIAQHVPSSYPFTYTLESGSSVTVEAVPTFGHVFDSWSGDLSGTSNPATLVIDCNKNITANFSIDWILIGTTTGSLVIVAFLVSVLIIKRKAG